MTTLYECHLDGVCTADTVGALLERITGLTGIAPYLLARGSVDSAAFVEHEPPKPGQAVSLRAVYDSPVVAGNLFDFIDMLDFE
ncbi:hypothetical protein HDU77_007807 [Chytriomyces hyalinus]|nr:hypothetical protein HDU77_007807 [Chytriomyces hyalinus]